MAYEKSSTAAIGNEGPRARAIRLDNEAKLLSRNGDLAGARRLYLEAAEIKRTTASPTSLYLTLRLLGRVETLQGNFKAARATYEEACRVGTAANYPRGLWFCEFDRAEMLLVEGSPEKSLRAALAVSAPHSPGAAVLLHDLIASSYLALFRPDDALRAAREGLARCEVDPTPAAIDCIRIKVTAAEAESALDHPAQAREFADSAYRDAVANNIMVYKLEARLLLASLAARNSEPQAPALASSLAADAARMGYFPIASAAKNIRLTR